MHELRPTHTIRWPLLLVGAVLTGVVALSVHVVMLQVIGIPYPALGAIPKWLLSCNGVTSYIAVVVLALLAAKPTPLAAAWVRWLLLTVAYLMIRETLRAGIMEGVVTTTYAKPLLGVLPNIVLGLVVCGIATVAADRLPRWAAVVFGTAAMYAVATWLVRPYLMAPLTAWIGSLGLPEGDEVYKAPYGFHVLLPAYLTFAEAVLGAFVACRLAWRSGRYALAGFAVAMTFLVPFLHATALLPVWLAIVGPLPWWEGFLSAFQFSLEHAVLGLGAAFAWWWAVPRGEH
ncbi:hypothetical protein [Luteibacter yeojuensis]|uniref:Uncharacterized protein n=1 Tax=Luteibacter yeojuensis TaxID=345309 RepID=A0A0F3KZI4_9GAMM|nr:hypothetical protein [Luteibacter yeojuensis]KJV36551.1 hypothetical protein VI08_04175 [Luteibacter yeojuensis]